MHISILLLVLFLFCGTVCIDGMNEGDATYKDQVNIVLDKLGSIPRCDRLTFSNVFKDYVNKFSSNLSNEEALNLVPTATYVDDGTIVTLTVKHYCKLCDATTTGRVLFTDDKIKAKSGKGPFLHGIKKHIKTRTHRENVEAAANTDVAKIVEEDGNVESFTRHSSEIETNEVRPPLAAHEYHKMQIKSQFDGIIQANGVKNTLFCRKCNHEFKMQYNTSDFINCESHLNSSKCKSKTNGSLTRNMFDFYKHGQQASLPSGSNKMHNKICRGFWLNELMIDNVKYDVKELAGYRRNTNYKWYWQETNPFTLYETANNEQQCHAGDWSGLVMLEGVNDPIVVPGGTFRHVHCNEGCLGADNLPLKDFMCVNCKSIANDSQFIAALKRANNRKDVDSNSPDKTNIRYLQVDKALTRCEKIYKDNRMMRLKIHTLQRTIDRQKAREDKLSDAAKQGDIKKMIFQLCDLIENGVEEDKPHFLAYILDMVNNAWHHMNGTSNGIRYHESTKNIFTAMRIMVGPRATRLLRNNIGGPSATTVETKIRQTRTQTDIGVSHNNFIAAAKMYRGQLSKLNNYKEGELVIVEMAEDETGVIPKPEWDPHTDTIIGLCGPDIPEHKCVSDYGCRYKIGNDEYSEQKLINSYELLRTGTYARALILNPLVSSMSRKIVFIQATCNKFDATPHVAEQWRDLDALFDQYVLPEGLMLVGHASDGDARRFTLQHAAALKNAKLQMASTLQTCENNYCPDSFNCSPSNKEELQYGLDIPGFTLPAKLSVPILMKNGKTRRLVRDLHSQDPFHNGKKIDNQLASVKTLQIGEHLVTDAHLKYIFNNYDDSGLYKDDIDRMDRQSVMAMVRRSGSKVIEHLGSAVQQSKGTHAICSLIRKYMLMFYSERDPYITRVESAGYVVTFLRLWRLSVRHNKDQTLGSNFITKQTYQHLVLSCHSAVNLIRTFRDYCPSQECKLNKSGSDVCERVFADCGGFGAIINHVRNYSFAEFRRMCDRFDQLANFAVDSNGNAGLKFEKAHKKQEFKNKIMEDMNQEKSDMLDYPDDTQMIQAWKAGENAAKSMMKSLGVTYGNTKPKIKRNLWDNPHKDENGDYQHMRCLEKERAVKEKDRLRKIEEQTEAARLEVERLGGCGDANVIDVEKQELAMKFLDAIETLEDSVVEDSSIDISKYYTDSNDKEQLKSACLQKLWLGKHKKTVTKDRLGKVKAFAKMVRGEENDALLYTLDVNDNCAFLFENDTSDEEIVYYGRIMKIYVTALNRTRCVNSATLGVASSKTSVVVEWYTKVDKNLYQFSTTKDYSKYGINTIISKVTLQRTNDNKFKDISDEKTQAHIVDTVKKMFPDYVANNAPNASDDDALRQDQRDKLEMMIALKKVRKWIDLPVHKHKLKMISIDDRDEIICDVCNRETNKSIKGKFLFECRTCEFDICERCAQKSTETPAKPKNKSVQNSSYPTIDISSSLIEEVARESKQESAQPKGTKRKCSSSKSNQNSSKRRPKAQSTRQRRSEQASNAKLAYALLSRFSLLSEFDFMDCLILMLIMIANMKAFNKKHCPKHQLKQHLKGSIEKKDLTKLNVPVMKALNISKCKTSCMKKLIYSQKCTHNIHYTKHYSQYKHLNLTQRVWHKHLCDTAICAL